MGFKRGRHLTTRFIQVLIGLNALVWGGWLYVLVQDSLTLIREWYFLWAVAVLIATVPFSIWKLRSAQAAGERPRLRHTAWLCLALMSFPIYVMIAGGG